MNPAIQRMLDRYPRNTADQAINALREILQQLALLGLWRSKFFEHAAFYGGTALRVLHGLDRYSEDLNFSLLVSRSDFSLAPYGSALRQEIASFGFDVTFETRGKRKESAIESAFIKTNTIEQMIVIESDRHLLGGLHPSQRLRIRLEVDVDPPGGFETEVVPVLQPIPFAVRAYRPPDLFAGKMHALLCRRWRNRVKGRDWYDFVWYVANHPQLHLSHLEQRMRHSGDYTDSSPLGKAVLVEMIHAAVRALDIDKARAEALPFLSDPRSVEVWSVDFFSHLIDKLEIV